MCNIWKFIKICGMFSNSCQESPSRCAYVQVKRYGRDRAILAPDWHRKKPLTLTTPSWESTKLKSTGTTVSTTFCITNSRLTANRGFGLISGQRNRWLTAWSEMWGRYIGVEHTISGGFGWSFIYNHIKLFNTTDVAIQYNVLKKFLLLRV